MALLTGACCAGGRVPLMRSASLSCLLVAFLLGAEREARAEVPDLSAARDEVVLKSGGMLRGTVIDEEQDRHVVVIVFGTNEERVVPWSSIERVERNKHASSPPPPAPPAAPAGAPEPAPVPSSPPRHGGVVRVHLASTEPGAPEMSLYRWTGNTEWLSPTDQTEFHERGLISTGSQRYGPPLGVLECRSPCGVLVDGSGGHEFVLSGPGITDSAPFHLLDWQGEVTLRVNPGNFKVHGWGVWMLEPTTSLVPMLVGPALIGVSVAVAEPPLPFNVPLLITGSSISVLSGVIPLVGFILTLATRTSYEVVPHQTATALLPQLAPGGLGWRF